MLFMFPAAPVLWEGDSGLKLRDLIVEFSRWVLGPWFLSTVAQPPPFLVREEVDLPNNYWWILPDHPSSIAATPADSRQLQLRP